MIQDPAIAPRPVGRIVGWDLLRGCCAYAIAIYHLMAWQKVADIHTIGFYGVYLFFVLSGASLVFNYFGQFSARPTLAVYLRFLFVRYMRLLPLFAVLVMISLLWKLRVQGMTPYLLLQTGLNLSFTFGLDDPLLTSMVVGGWSLGIEFVFYLLFPVFVWLLGHPRQPWRRWVALALLLVLQFYWISSTIARDATSMAMLSAYHQVPAFAAYFFGGCIVGWLYLEKRWLPQLSPGFCLAGLVVAALLFIGLNIDDPAAVLNGWRGGVLTGLCLVLVWWAGLARFGPRLSRFAAFAGDVTYGVYLLHPLLYFGLAFGVAPRVSWLNMTAGPSTTALALGAAVVCTASLLAWLSEKWFEQPIRRWSTRKKQVV